jgi:hypothetical protein
MCGQTVDGINELDPIGCIFYDGFFTWRKPTPCLFVSLDMLGFTTKDAAFGVSG